MQFGYSPREKMRAAVQRFENIVLGSHDKHWNHLRNVVVAIGEVPS